MTKGFFTQTELVNMKILSDSNRILSNRLNDLINSHKNSAELKSAIAGINYYKGKHDILKYQPYYWIDGVKRIDNTKTNYTIPHLFHKILVDQKASYIAGNPVKIFYSLNNDNGDNTANTVLDNINEVLGDNFNDVIVNWIIDASNQGIGWIHFYIDDEGKLNFLNIDSTELIPIYDSAYQKNLVGMIRYYQVFYYNEQMQTTDTLYKLEWWTDNDVTYYAQLPSGEWILDPEVEINPSGHWILYNSINPENKKIKSWNKVPFIKLENNSINQTDLEPIKALIDAYDRVKSGWINDLIDFQELIYILKGYNGLSFSGNKGLNELTVFIQNLKQDKVISVDEGGGVDTIKSEIPIEAKNKFLELTRKEIFYFGQGVDIDSDKFGNNPSGISLKFLYSSLDMKANSLIRKLNSSLKEFMEFVIIYLNNTKAIKIDINNIIYVFNKAVIFNEKEKVDLLKASEGILSKRTIIENHPLVEDVSEELSRIEKEQLDDINKGIVNLDDFQEPDEKNDNSDNDN